MAGFIFTYALGREAEFFNRVQSDDPSASRFVLIGINANGATDAVLKDTPSVAALLATAANEVTNGSYARGQYTEADLSAITVDTEGNRTTFAFPAYTWTSIDAGDAWTDLVIAYDNSGGDSDSTLIPVALVDLTLTPDGSGIQFGGATVEVDYSAIEAAIVQAVETSSGQTVAAGTGELHPTTGFPLDAEGFHDLSAIVNADGAYLDARFMYVDPSNPAPTPLIYGKGQWADMFNPSTTPAAYATIAAARAQMRNGFPDVLLLKRGEKFSETINIGNQQGGRSTTERTIWGAYGSTSLARPELTSTGGRLWIYGEGTGGGNFNVSYILIADLDFHPLARDPNEATFTGTTNGNLHCRIRQAISHVLVEGCVWRYCGGEVQEYVPPEQVPGWSRPSNIIFRRCAWYNNYPQIGTTREQNLYVNETDTILIEECVNDHGGWDLVANPAAPQDIGNHNFYLQINSTDVTVRRTITARASSHGIHHRPGGLMEENLCLQNPLVQMGYSASPETGNNPFTGIVRRNVFLDSRDINTIPRSYGIRLEALQNSTITDNIVAHQVSGNGTGQGISYGHFSPENVYADNITISNNIVYDWCDATPGTGRHYNFETRAEFPGSSYTNMTVTNNVSGVVTDGVRHIAAPYADGDFTFTNNTYFDVGVATGDFSGGLDFNGWVAAAPEATASNTDPSYTDPNRTIETYMENVVGAANDTYENQLEAFLVAARENRKGAWNTAYIAETVINYIRAGFDKSAI